MQDLDKYVFKWIKSKLGTETNPDTICAFYVQNFVFKNGDYWPTLMRDYKLPNDFLKLHKRILQLAEAESISIRRRQ